MATPLPLALGHMSWAQNITKMSFRLGLSSDSAGGAYSAPQTTNLTV